MKSRGKFSGSFLAGLLGLFIAIPVTAQEYDDMYFRKSDRKVKAADTEKVVSDKEATNPDLQRPAGSNINPDYLSRYDLVESDTTEGYFDEDYAADMSTQGQSGTTVINNYYGSGGLQSWDDIYWSDPFFYRNTVYDPFYRMRMRTWGTFYSWNRWYYYRPVVYSYGWGWGWGPTYYNGWNYAGAFYDPWYYNGFYSWNTCPFYPSYAYYGYNRYPGTWFYSSPYGYVTYVDQAGGRDITRGRRSSRSSIATGRYAGGGIASSAVSSRSSVRGGRVISSDAVPTRRTSSRVASSSTTSGRTGCCARTSDASPGRQRGSPRQYRWLRPRR